jgi:putative membrane protein
MAAPDKKETAMRMHHWVLIAALALPGLGPFPALAQTAPLFVVQAGSANQFEIEHSRIALEKVQSPAIREFAQKVIQDHMQAGKEMQEAIAQSGLALPQLALEGRHRDLLEALRTAQGAEIDLRYLQAQRAAHEEAVNLFKAFASQGDNPALRSFAQKQVPILEEHLAMVQRLGPPVTR